MKKIMVVLMLLTLVFCLGAVRLYAQQKSSITVRGSELNNGVVILDVLRGEKSFKLQCNQGASACTALTTGKYLMIELPKNFGMYECRDVEVYPETVTSSDTGMPDKDKKVGEYCLIEK
jgi:hypothetical protein